jgi:hypothetical protein
LRGGLGGLFPVRRRRLITACRQLRRLDVKAAMKKVPQERKHVLEEANATNP